MPDPIPPQPPAQPAAAGGEELATTLIVIGDDGKVYKLKKTDYAQQAFLVEDPNSLVKPTEVRALNAYLAFPPPNQGAGVGLTCTIVNLEAVLANQRIADHFNSKRKGTAPAAGISSGAGTAAGGGTAAAGGIAPAGK